MSIISLTEQTAEFCFDENLVKLFFFEQNVLFSG